VSATPDDLAAKAAALEGEVIREGEAPAAGSEEAAPGQSTGQVIAMILRPAFDVIAPAWNVTDAECAMLGDTYGAVVDKYFPDLDLGVELAALFTTALVFGPRMKKPRHNPPPAPAADDGEKTSAG
jgi:hypothetical protein